jgi:hypothetical protein
VQNYNILQHDPYRTWRSELDDTARIKDFLDSDLKIYGCITHPFAGFSGAKLILPGP